jgi:hypothetical protein
MVGTIKSKNPCPFCGKKEWIILSLDDNDEWLELLVSYPCLKTSNTISLVDFDIKTWENYETIKNSSFDGQVIYVDECASCGALVQG